MNLEELDQRYKEEIEQAEEAVQQGRDSQERKGNKKRVIALVVFLVLLLSAAVVITVPRLLGNSQETLAAENVEGEIMPGVPEGMDEGEIAKALQEQIDESMFTVSVNTRPVFQNGNAKGKVNIINSPQNHYPCRVKLTLDEDGTVLYKNDDLLYPEQYIPEIKLSKNLSKGVYDATLTYLIYEDDGETQAGMMSAKMEIVIQN